ncbi:hypothetical protein Tco_0293407 [Tanacetum coccineum]
MSSLPLYYMSSFKVPKGVLSKMESIRRNFFRGDENSKFFHGIINKKRSQLAIHGVLAVCDWIVEPSLVKNEFLKHFATRFAAPSSSSITFTYQFPNPLTPEEIKRAA